MKAALDSFFSMGMYAYFIIGMFIFSGVYAIFYMKMNKKAKEKWLDEHKGAVKVSLSSGTNLITSKQLLAEVVSGEAAIFTDKTSYVIYAMPGDIGLRVTYSYTKPGVLHKTVTTTWGPTTINLHLDPNKEYALTFDKKEEEFKLEEI